MVKLSYLDEVCTKQPLKCMFKMLFWISTVFLCNNFLSNVNNLENSLKFQPNFSLVLLIKLLLIKKKACIWLENEKYKNRRTTPPIYYNPPNLCIFFIFPPTPNYYNPPNLQNLENWPTPPVIRPPLQLGRGE